MEEQPSTRIVLILDDNPGTGVLETLLQTANDLVDELLTRPRRAQELYDQLPEGVRRQAQPAAGS
ncbi:hypothetical protein [Amycolatopsis sp. FDAARGOS 1241]|uniref:hypothetical protein n=1 Tax=Amycolatopsis sp. FDAARGOS 1241 TaxID=2778070 RepID=UPI00194DBD8E|nr:hypothetical protein [Amycolatopsis sp. FDAARGOS 1241]QRP42968.1 hypothetical protein I6J71_26345 [Amycolatopsis sp. FDAARGOS 1241]